MILTTTTTIEGHPISAYKGIVVGEAIMSAYIARSVFPAASTAELNR